MPAPVVLRFLEFQKLRISLAILVNLEPRELLHEISRAAFLFAAVHWRLMETSTAGTKKIHAEGIFFHTIFQRYGAVSVNSSIQDTPRG